MICKNKNCDIEYNIPYGYGEFCSSRCANMRVQTSEIKENLQQKPDDDNTDSEFDPNRQMKFDADPEKGDKK